jgi:hypothetical protein
VNHEFVWMIAGQRLAELLKRPFGGWMAATALGTWLYGGLGSGRDKDKASVNALKKQADAISAYILSEALFFSTRGLPENHALLVSAGEGWMPKAGETPEQGANPQIAFGRIFARPDVARFLQKQVGRLIKGSSWKTFLDSIQQEHLTVLGSGNRQLGEYVTIHSRRFDRADGCLACLQPAVDTNQPIRVLYGYPNRAARGRRGSGEPVLGDSLLDAAREAASGHQ